MNSSARNDRPALLKVVNGCDHCLSGFDQEFIALHREARLWVTVGPDGKKSL